MKRTRNSRLLLALLAACAGFTLIVVGYGSPLGSRLTNLVVSYLGFGVSFLGLRWLVQIVKSAD